MGDEPEISQSGSLDSLSLGRGIKSTWDPLCDKNLVIKSSDNTFTKALGACSLSKVHQYGNNQIISQSTTSSQVSQPTTTPESFPDFAKFDTSSSIQSTYSGCDHTTSPSVSSSSSVVASESNRLAAGKGISEREILLAQKYAGRILLAASVLTFFFGGWLMVKSIAQGSGLSRDGVFQLSLVLGWPVVHFVGADEMHVARMIDYCSPAVWSLAVGAVCGVLVWAMIVD